MINLKKKNSKINKNMLNISKSKNENILISQSNVDINNLITIKNRLKQVNLLNKILKKYDIKSKSVRCIKNDLDKYIDINKLLGSGTWGLVHLIQFKNNKIKIALKKSIIEENGFFNISELIFLTKNINPLIKKKYGPGFPYTYVYFTCNKCNFILNKKHILNKQCGISLSEFANYDLIKFDSILFKQKLNSKIIDNILFNMYFQCMYSIAVLHKYTGIVHFDIKLENFLIYKVPKGKYWEFIINNNKFYLPNLGFIMILNDFGISKYVFPNNNYSIKPYRYTFGEITNNYYSTYIPMPQNIDKSNYTLNHYKNFLNNNNFIINNNLYSPYFCYDVIDCFYMFKGNSKRTTHDGCHYGLDIFKSSKKFKNVYNNLLNLKDYGNKNHLMWKRLKQNNLQNFEDAKFVSAIHNILYIYKNMYNIKPKSIEILESYKYNN
jgi:hypothetical protein